MRTAILAAALAAAGCVSSGPKPEHEPTEAQKKVAEEARAAFEAWRDALAEGKADEGWVLITAANKSEWLYDLMGDDDVALRRWKQRLPDGPRTDLELWYHFSKKHRDRLGRAEILPDSVLFHPSLRDLWEHYFSRALDAIKGQMSRVRVENVAVDGTGVTVTVRNALGRIEMYSMAMEDGYWKVDGHLESARAGGR